MPKPASVEFVDTAQIVEVFDTSATRISDWYRDRATTGFPEVDHTDGRKRYWVRDQVATWFAEREQSRAAGKVPPALLEGDPDDLLTTAEINQLLGFKNASTIHNYLRDHPGLFPEPDETLVVADGRRGRPPEMRWRRGTISEWAKKRPGKGRRPQARSQAVPLPDVPVDGDPDELLGTPEAAALLGYGNWKSFSSALSQGTWPELKEPDELQAGARGGPRRMWKRSTILAARARRDRPN